MENIETTQTKRFGKYRNHTNKTLFIFATLTQEGKPNNLHTRTSSFYFYLNQTIKEWDIQN